MSTSGTQSHANLCWSRRVVHFDGPCSLCIIFSLSRNKVARRPVETVPWSAVETVPLRVSLRQRAQFQKAAPEGTVS